MDGARGIDFAIKACKSCVDLLDSDTRSSSSLSTSSAPDHLGRLLNRSMNRASSNFANES
jgi:hypothetical protein